MSSITYFARANWRQKNIRFGIKEKDRLNHFYTFGKTGTGKTTLLQTLMMQDAQNGKGFCFIDPHGDSVSRIIRAIPSNRRKDVIYLDLTNNQLHWGYNPLRKVPPNKRSLICSSILDVFRREWSNAWGPKMEHILRMILLTLLDQPKATIADINRMVLDDWFRNNCLQHVLNEDVKKFWVQEFPKYRSGDLLPILSKTGGFLSHTIIKKVLVENSKQISVRYLMDNKKILLINLAKGHLGTDVSNLLGGLLLTTIASASFSRIDTKESYRVPFYVYIDEFQTVTNETLIAEMLSELRKFKIGLILSNQFLSQLSSTVRDGILGNVGTIACFRLGINDARVMCQEFDLFKPHDYTNLPQGRIYIRLMIDGKPSKAFSGTTLYYPIRSP